MNDLVHKAVIRAAAMHANSLEASLAELATQLEAVQEELHAIVERRDYLEQRNKELHILIGQLNTRVAKAEDALK